MKKILFFSISFLFLRTASAEKLNCEKAHDKALLTCKAHENGITAEQIQQVSLQTRERVASKESDRLFSMGKACAQSQNLCKKICSEALSKNKAKIDFTKIIELQSDCAEGEIAIQRSMLAQKYLSMKAVRDNSRTPSSR